MSGLNYFAGLENRYLYQGKEATGDFGLWWSDFHARRFDSQLGRWHIPDPAGQFASSYVGMGNNPVIAVDPDGRWAVGSYGQYARLLAEASRELSYLYKDYYDWIDSFSSRFGFRGNIIKWDPNMVIAGGGCNAGNSNQSSTTIEQSGNSSQINGDIPSSEQYAIYTGENVEWYTKEGELLDSYPASSGLTEGLADYRNSKYQNRHNQGPIPEGTYSINLDLNIYRYAKVLEWYPFDLEDDFGIQQILSPIFIQGYIVNYEEGWGTIRARLEHVSGNSYNRGGFYIHNSHKGYTHGCIEVANGFFIRLMNYALYYNTFFLNVHYPNPNNTSTSGATWEP